MVLRKLFGGAAQEPKESEYTVDDLIVLERFDEAKERLQARIRLNPQDLHAHLRLADVFIATGQPVKALDEYLFVVDSYADDGFYDKGIALLARAEKLAPADEELRKRLARLQRLKRLEHSRAQFIEGMAERESEMNPLARRSPVELQMIWQRLATTRFVLGIPSEQLRRLGAVTDLRDWQPGETVARRGTAEGGLVIVVQGQIEAVLDKPEGGQFSLRSFTTGDVFGEWPLLEQRPWPATLVAREASQGLIVTRPGLEKALLGNPDPRALIEALRAQRNDADLANAVRRLLAGP